VIVTRESVRAAFERAMKDTSSRDDAIARAAQALCLPPEAVREVVGGGAEE
jgi:hypothetical protein